MDDDFFLSLHQNNRNQMHTLYNSILKASTITADLKDIAQKILEGSRITTDEALVLYQKAPLGLLGMLAFAVKESKTGRKVFFNRNFHTIC